MGFLSNMGGVLGSMFGSGSALRDIGGDMASAFTGGVSGAIGTNKKPQTAQDTFVGMRSSLQGPTPPPPAGGIKGEVTGSQAPQLNAAEMLGKAANDILTGTVSGASSDIVDRLLKNDPQSLAEEKGSAARGYLDAAFPEANVWDKMGASSGAAGAVGADTSASSAQRIVDKQNRQQDQIVDKQIESQNHIAGLNGAVSYINQHDQMLQNARLVDAQVNKAQAESAAILSNTALDPSRREQMLSSAAASTAAAGQSAALTKSEEAFREARLNQLQHPGKYGEIYTTGKNVINEGQKVFDEKVRPALGKLPDGTLPFGMKDKTLNEAWDSIKGYFNEQVDNTKASGGILGATSRKQK